jgi:putative membrane protein
MKGLFVILAMSALVGVASAQQVISQDGRPEKMNYIAHKTGISAADHKTLQTIYLGNAFEIKASEIARRRGRSQFTREFAKEMIHEHTNAQNELKLLARAKNVWLSNDLPKDMQAMLRKLNTVSASNFDSTYRKIQLSAHSAASMALQAEIKRGHDEMVRSYAIKLLPSVKDHYTMAKIQKTMMGATATKEAI